jgi:RsiW-degrading membrane proteinase PrsW (M82 family)
VLFEFLLASAVVPSMLLIWFFHARDVYPEPQRVVWATFGLGVATCVPAIALELPIAAAIKNVPNPLAQGTLEGFFCAGMVEEALKYCVVVFYCMRHREFDEPMDGIVYGAVASLGFATLENVLYVSQGGLGQAVLRAASAVPGHACMGAIMGYFVGQAKFAREGRGALLAKAYVVPWLLHGLYDAPLLTVGVAVKSQPKGQPPDPALLLVALVTLVVLVAEITWTLVLTQRLRRQQQGWKAQGWTGHGWQQQAQAWQAPGPPIPWPQPPAVARSGSVAGAVVMLVFGTLLACGGGLMSLGAMVAIGDHQDQVGALLFVGFLFGVLPLAVGALLFGLGLRSLTRAAPRPPPAARAY